MIEVKCDKPSFIINHPLIMSPLAKSHEQGRFYGDGLKYPEIPESVVPKGAAPYLSERFELFINGMEIINSYSEQNSEERQRHGFELQNSLSSQKDEELHRNDEDFLEALSYGMPPTAGWGCGIDRLAMLFCGVSNIREIIMFPMFRSSILKKKAKK